MGDNSKSAIIKSQFNLDNAKKYCLAYRNKKEVSYDPKDIKDAANQAYGNWNEGHMIPPDCNRKEVGEALIVNKDRDIPGQYSGWISTTSNQTFYSNAGNMRFGGKKLRRKTYKKSHRKSSKKSHRKSRRGGKSRRGRR